MTQSAATTTDEEALVAAVRTIAWVILLNKPFYPLYVWYLVGNGTWVSLLTLLGAPLFLAVILMADRAPQYARLCLPIFGAVDTIGETFVFGAGSGCELFLAACLLLAVVGFRAGEEVQRRGVCLAIFVAFVALRGRYGEPVFPWTDQEIATLRSINIFAVASLLLFIALRFPIPGQKPSQLASHSFSSASARSREE